MANPQPGNKVSYNGGKFQLFVGYHFSGEVLNIRPYVVVSGGGFYKNHKASIAYDHRKKEGQAKETTEHRSEKALRQNGTYYFGDTSHKKKKVRFEYKTKKGKVKKTKPKKKTVDVLKKNQGWLSTYDNTVTVTLTVAGCKTKSKVTIRAATQKPKSASIKSVTQKNGINNVQIATDSIPATIPIPVTTVALSRKDNIEVNSWTHIETYTPKATPGQGGTTNPFAYTFSEITTLQAGNRYKWKITVSNAKGSTDSKGTDWYYAPPANVENVSHERFKSDKADPDTQNLIIFTRDKNLITLGIIQGFRYEYTTKLPTDPDPDSAWYPLKKGEYKFYNINPGKNHNSVMDQTVNTVAILHTNCKPDMTYRYRVYAYNFWHKKPDTKKVPDIYSWSETQYSEYSSREGTEPTYNTPNTPKSVTAVYDTANDEVDLEIERSAPKTTADTLFVQRKIDNGEWEYVPYGSGQDGIPISPSEIAYELTTDLTVYNGRTYYTRSEQGGKYVYTKVQNPVESDLSTYYVKIAGGTITYFSDTELYDALGKTIVYRAAFGCSKTPIGEESMTIGNGRSGWKESTAMVLLSTPNPPTLILPIKDSIVTSDTESVRLGWVHSPNDGTSQEAAKIQYRVKGSSEWSEPISVETDSYYDLSLAGFNVNDTVEWRASTKGKYNGNPNNGFSSYSEPSEFKIYAKPYIQIQAPVETEDISKLPIALEWLYEDQSGSLSKMDLEISQDNNLLATFDIAEPETGIYTINDFLFEDGESYTLSLNVESTTGLSATATIIISVKYGMLNLTKGYILGADFDEETGYTKLSVSRLLNSEMPEPDPEEEGEEQPETSDAYVKRIYVYRYYDGKNTLIQNLEINNDTEVIHFEDRYAPINREFEYKLVQITELNEVSLTNNDFIFESLWWYIYWNEDEVIRFKWNPQGTMNASKPNMQQVRYSGREYPVIYDDGSNEETYSLSAVVLKDEGDGWETISDMKEFIKYGSTGVWKSFEGDVYAGTFTFSYSSDYTNTIPMWNCNINVTRIESEDL